MIWFIFLFCVLDEVYCTGCYWWLGDAGLVLMWFPLHGFYFVLPRVTSLGSWSQCSNSKGSGLDFSAKTSLDPIYQEEFHPK